MDGSMGIYKNPLLLSWLHWTHPASVSTWGYGEELLTVGRGTELKEEVRLHGKAHLVYYNHCGDHTSLFNWSSPFPSCISSHHSLLLPLALTKTLFCKLH